jgi:hypothetical protein
MAGNVHINPTPNIGIPENPVTPVPDKPNIHLDTPSLDNAQQLPSTPGTNVQQPTKVPDAGAAAEVVEDADAAHLPESTDATAEESLNRYIVVELPDDSEAGETNDNVPVFAILLLIVLTVAIAVACIRTKKKRAAEVEADGYPSISRNTSEIKNDKEEMENFGHCKPNIKPSAFGFISRYGREWEAEYEAKNERKRQEQIKNRRSEAKYYARKYDIPIEEFYPDKQSPPIGDDW